MKRTSSLLLLLLLTFAGALGVMRTGAAPMGLTISPEIVTFTATPSKVSPGEPVTVEWTTRSTTSVTLDWGVEGQARESMEMRDGLPSSGSMTFRPIENTTFVLECETAFGAMCMSASAAVRMK